jgi:hypothetical protein
LFNDFGNFIWRIRGCTLPLSLDESPEAETVLPEGKGLLSVATEGTAPMTEAQAKSGHYEENISANGVLFAMDKDVPVGSMVEFTILLPGDVVGARKDVQIDCRGRVVRSFEDRGRRGVGVVIDEYHFERA